MKIFSRIRLKSALLALLLLWSTAFFVLMNPVYAVDISVLLVSSFILLILILGEISVLHILYINFLSVYVLLGYVSFNGWVSWLVMILVAITASFLITYLHQIKKISQDQKLAIILIFALLVLETYIFLGYFIIGPINQSIIITLVVYLICGYLDTVVFEKNVNRIMTYIFVFLAVFVTIVLSANWGGL